MNCFSDERQACLTDVGLLILRLSVGLLMAFSHGLGKVQKFFTADPIQFPDPIGLGPAFSLALAGGAEFFLSLFLVVGFLTRISTIPLIITMLVAIVIFHADDPFGKKEFGMLFLFPYITLLLTGPGRFSIDSMLKKKCIKSCDIQ